jgi:RNA polymerase sigma factor (TIGR02999 family)
MPIGPDDTTRLLIAVNEGDREAAERLMDAVYDELRSIAAAYFRRERAGHTLQPTALVHETYLRLVGGNSAPWTSRAHFLAVAAKAMRNTLVNHALARKAAKRGGQAATIDIDLDSAASQKRPVETLSLDQALKDLAALDARKAQVVELRFFGGMTVEETAHVLNVSVSTVEADWRMAKAWLCAELASD